MTSPRVARKNRKPAYNVSKIKTYLRCRRQFYYRYDFPSVVLGKKQREMVPKRPGAGLRRGSWMHELMQQHWLAIAGEKASWKARHKELTEEFEQLFEEEQEYYGDLPRECYGLMTRYLRYYHDDDEKYRIVRMPKGGPAIEFTFEVPLHPFGVDGYYKGKIDLVVEDLEYGGLWIRDAKWVRSIPGPDERMMSPQNIMYAWGLRHLGWDIRGFIYDYGRTKPPTLPMVLKSGMITTRKNLDTDFLTYIRAIKRQHGDRWKSYARTVYKEKLKEVKARDTLWFDRARIPLDGPRMDQGFEEFIQGCNDMDARTNAARTYLFNCRWNCDYHELCVADFQGLDTKQLIKTQFALTPERYGIEEIN